MTRRGVNIWDFWTLLLWSLFFAAGLVPEPVFVTLRQIAAVPMQSAFVNSSAVITVGFAVYLALFARRRCLDSGLSPGGAQSRAVQVGLIGLLAFLELPSRGGFSDGRTLLYLVVRSHEIHDTYLKTVVLAVGISKLVAWWYLFSMILRYHAFGTRDVFTRMSGLFPSARSVSEPAPEEIVAPETPAKFEADSDLASDDKKEAQSSS